MGLTSNSNMRAGNILQGHLFISTEAILSSFQQTIAVTLHSEHSAADSNERKINQADSSETNSKKSSKLSSWFKGRSSRKQRQQSDAAKEGISAQPASSTAAPVPMTREKEEFIRLIVSLSPDTDNACSEK